MTKSKGWDLTSLHSLEGAAEWIRKNSDALLVLVVRAEDVAFAVDPQVSPSSAVEMVELVMPNAMIRLEQMRIAARDRAAEKKRQGR
jgi:hypothetical protein